jgi:DNA-binding response OmpR family regulator
VPKILVVDDDRVIQQLIEVNLELEGYVVVKASNGEEALAMFASEHPDLVILDVMMPKLNGKDVCRKLKSDPVSAKTPIIFLSARAQEMDVEAGLELGADAYVTKPFDPSTLLETVSSLLGDA